MNINFLGWKPLITRLKISQLQKYKYYIYMESKTHILRKSEY